MRVLIAVFLLGVCGRAEAQPSGAATDQAPTSTLPPIGLPLPPIGLPLPAIGLAPAGPTPTTTAPSQARQREPRHGRAERRASRPGPSVIYVVPVYGWDAAAPSVITGPPAPRTPEPPTPAALAAGTLHLELDPRPTGQLFVDGAYVGTLDELGTDLTLLAGTREIEIRQPGYRPFTLTARIVEGRALVYRGTLDASSVVPSTTAPEPPLAIARKPLFFIPGCYLGDVPPKEARLPSTCDPRNAVTFRP